MTMEYAGAGADTDTAGLEGGPSADAAGLQPPEAGDDGPDLGEQLGEIIARTVRAELEPFRRGIQSFTDRTANTLADLGQRIEALATAGAPIGELRDMVGDLHELTVDADVRKQKALERQLARLEREQRAPARPAAEERPQPVAPALDAAEAEARYYQEIAPDLEDYSRLRGFTDAELGATDWMARLAGAGAPQQIEYTPAGIRAYKDGMKQALDRLAAQKRAQTRGRTVTPNPATAGGGSRNYSTTAVRDIPDAEFEQNFADIARAVVAKNRR